MTLRERCLLTAIASVLAAACGAPSQGLPDAQRDGRPGDSNRDGVSVLDTGPERCAAGVDSDGDGLNNDVECASGSDPFNRDTDGDGTSDGTEARYPRICVATDRAMQRRPPTTCVDDAGCMPGERCTGLSSSMADSDGDGVTDAMEDLNGDGVIDTAHGETDPRLWDTDGDGRNDSMTGLDICRPAGLAMVRQAELAAIQLGHDLAWGMAVRIDGTMGRSALLLDDAMANVSGVVFTLTATGDVRMEQMRIEALITGAIGAGITPVLVGRPLTTHEMNPAITSTYRVARATSAAALRDALVGPMTGGVAPGGLTTGMSSEFLLDVTTVRRTMGSAMGRTDVVVTIAPRTAYDNVLAPTSIRANDLVNTTGVAESGKVVGSACQVFRADRIAMADFLWTVDTSGSMGPYQMRLGLTATAFFQRLNAAGVDFRVGVLQAGSATTGPNLDTPGFRWIIGSDAMGARRLCEEVTSMTLGTCPTSTTDALSPYVYAGGQEEPTAAAVLAHYTFAQRSRMGEMNPDRRFREGARVVTFHVTDEPGSNDFTRYFSRSADPETGMAYGTTYNAATRTNIVTYFRRNSVLTFGLLPLRPTMCLANDVYDLPRCIVEENGGAVIPIATATDSEVAAAMARIVDAVAGATSQFRLDRSPITATIKVRVRGMDVPRSRSEGFDYDPASRSVVFYGRMFRPALGDEVVVSYRVWEGSLG